jgi:hypothetical protein
MIKLLFHFSSSFIEPIVVNLLKSMQEISSAPPIVEGMDDVNGTSFLGKDLSCTQRPSMECFIESNPNQTACSLDNSEPPATQPTRGSEDNQLIVRKHGASLVDVKSDPEVEGYEIDSSGSQGISHHTSGNICLERADSVPVCVMKDHENEMSHHHRDFVENALDICNNISAEASSQNKNTHGDHSVPLSGVKSELTEIDFRGLCENRCANAAENIFEKTHTHILDHDGNITFRSHQHKKRKTARYAT